jgi:hypothetical protein
MDFLRALASTSLWLLFPKHCIHLAAVAVQSKVLGIAFTTVTDERVTRGTEIMTTTCCPSSV